MGQRKFYGFCLTKLSTIIQNDPYTSNPKLIIDFHMFNMNKKMWDWQEFYDIAGVNMYPNAAFGHPVLGFMVGEAVYSTRRALKSMGLSKDVWVTETGYASFYYDDSTNTPEGQEIFMKQAMESSYMYGAKAFCWFQTTDVTEKPERIGYSGLINAPENPNEIDAVAFSQANRLSDGINTTVLNKYGSEQLSGQIRIANFDMNINSGNAVRLTDGSTYTFQNVENVLTANDSSFVYFHHWEENEQNISRTNLVESTPMQNEVIQNYKDKSLLKFSDNGYEEYSLRNIEIQDPWLSENNWYSIVTLNDTNFVYVFKDEGNPDIPADHIYQIRLRNKYFVTEDAIYKFSGWEAWKNGSKLTDVTAASPNIHIITPGESETKLIIKSDNIEIRPMFTPINQIAGTYIINQTLTFLGNTNIAFAENIYLTLGLKGHLIGLNNK